MATISLFAFERESFQQAGPFHQIHQVVDAQEPIRKLLWDGMWGLPDTHAIFAYLRAENEIAQSLSDVVNSQAVLKFIDDQFKAAPENPIVHPPYRLGPVRSSYLPWGKADKTNVKDPDAHHDGELITTINIDFKANTAG